MSESSVDASEHGNFEKRIKNHNHNFKLLYPKIHDILLASKTIYRTASDKTQTRIIIL